MTAGRIQRLTPTPETMHTVLSYKEIEAELTAARLDLAQREHEIRMRMDTSLRRIVGDDHGSIVLAARLLGISDVQVSRRLRDALVRAVRYTLTKYGVPPDDYELVFHTGNRTIGLVPIADGLLSDVISIALAGSSLMIVEDRFRVTPKSEKDQWMYLKGAVGEVRTTLASAGVSPRAYRIMYTRGSLTFTVHPTKDGVLATIEDALQRGTVTVPYTITDVVTVVLPPIEYGPRRHEFVVTWR